MDIFWYDQGHVPVLIYRRGTTKQSRDYMFGILENKLILKTLILHLPQYRC